jgi:hypothetical protein
MSEYEDQLRELAREEEEIQFSTFSHELALQICRRKKTTGW